MELQQHLLPKLVISWQVQALPLPLGLVQQAIPEHPPLTVASRELAACLQLLDESGCDRISLIRRPEGVQEGGVS
jgi:hypothetical protein